MKVKSNAKNNPDKDRANSGFSIRGVEILGKEGFWDIEGSNEKIVSITNSSFKNGGIVTPRFSDIHVHLDKTGTSKRISKRSAALFDSINLMNIDKVNWTEKDIYLRANKALESAWNFGTGSMRTHVDWENKNIPLAWEVLKSLQKEWKGRIEIELVPLCPLDMAEKDIEKIAEVVQNQDSIMGFFIYRNENLETKLEKVFQIAMDHDLALDFHVDEGLDEDAKGFDHIIRGAEIHSMRGKVLCGHACSLAIRNGKHVSAILERAAKAEVGLTCLPTTNFWLQDNVCGVTPRLRGIAPIKEARDAGILTMIATDNCQDAFYPFGEYNLLSTYRLAVIGAHLDEKMWLDSITTWPANWMNVKSEIIEGGKASFLRFYINTFCDLITKEHIKYEIWHEGLLVNESG